MSKSSNIVVVSKRVGIAALLPIMAAVFVAYLIIGIPMPVLPLYVHQGLGFSAFVVGLVAGSQFGSALLSRVWAGRFSDSRGAKQAVICGLVVATLSGLLYLLSQGFTDAPRVAVLVVLLGRALLGTAESFLITGALSWGMSISFLDLSLALGSPTLGLVAGSEGIESVFLFSAIAALLGGVLIFRFMRKGQRPHNALHRPVLFPEEIRCAHSKC
jgi:MFS family permease